MNWRTSAAATRSLRLLAHLNRCLFWFHPLAWWLERTLALTAEHAADDAGVLAAGERRKYAEVLLDMAESVRLTGRRLAWQGVGVDNPGLLGQRIERILRGGLFRSVSRTRKTFVAVCCVAAIIIAAACRQRDFYTGALREDPEYARQHADQQAATDFSKAAREMTPQQAADLELAVAKTPDDMDARRKLMSYYQNNAQRLRLKEGVEPAYRAHKLWFIEHHPESEYTRFVNLTADPEGDQKARALWLTNVAKPDVSPRVLANAAAFFVHYDTPLAEKLLIRAEAADPKGEWAGNLGRLYADLIARTTGTGPEGEQIKKQLTESNDSKLLFAVGELLVMRYAAMHTRSDADIEALGAACLTRAAQLDPSRAQDADSLKGMAQIWSRKPPAQGSPLALARQATQAYIKAESADYYKHDPAAAKAGWEEARKSAQQALDTAARKRDDPDYGTAVHTANMTLGMVAMRVDGNKKAAAKYLLEAAQAPATDDLAYAPDYFTQKLPVLLLKYGGLDEREAVIQFLDSLRKGRQAPRLHATRGRRETPQGLHAGLVSVSGFAVEVAARRPGHSADPPDT